MTYSYIDIIIVFLEILTLLAGFGSFVIALLTYLENKKKKKRKK
jgi:hypothetical protein